MENPPDYNLKNVHARVILHYSDNDWLSAPIDVARLHAQLPNAEKNHIPDEKFERKLFLMWNFYPKKIEFNAICHIFILPFYRYGFCLGYWSQRRSIQSNHCEHGAI